jgi:ribosome-associated toxin RatA of RatAB toxin-antitoxin module
VRELTLNAHAQDKEPGPIFTALADFGDYESRTDTVIDVTVEPLAPGRTRSAWTVRFRDGILKYVSEETADADSGEIRFKAVDGDLEEFEGFWRVAPNHSGTDITLHVAFDSGLGTLAELVDPIAERTLRENFATILTAVVEDVELVS